MMGKKLSAEEWEKLPVDERIRRCLLKGRETRQLAADADPVDRTHFLDIADRWDNLARAVAAWGSSWSRYRRVGQWPLLHGSPS